MAQPPLLDRAFASGLVFFFGLTLHSTLRRCALGHINVLPELLTRALAYEVRRRAHNDSMSSPDPGHECMSLTNRESLIRTQVADPRITHGRYHAQSAKGTEVRSCIARGTPSAVVPRAAGARADTGA
jgi:hypothetical protein